MIQKGNERCFCTNHSGLAMLISGLTGFNLKAGISSLYPFTLFIARKSSVPTFFSLGKTLLHKLSTKMAPNRGSLKLCEKRKDKNKMNQLIILNKQVNFFPFFLWVMDEGITYHFSGEISMQIMCTSFLILKPFFKKFAKPKRNLQVYCYL